MAASAAEESKITSAPYTAIVIIGLDTGEKSMRQEMCHVILNDAPTAELLGSTPTYVDFESAACVHNNTLYAIGIGRSRKELWKWSATEKEWTRCADLPEGIRRHCAACIDAKIYVLGGCRLDGNKETLNTVLCYDINENVWSQVGRLQHEVNSASCTAYKNRIYVFGGRKNWEEQSLDLIQIYDTETRSTAIGRDRLPLRERHSRALTWNDQAIVVGRYNAYLYDFNTQKLQIRDRFKVNIWRFGLTINNDTLYLTGGGVGTPQEDKHGWEIRDDVFTLSAEDFRSDNPEAEWKLCAHLPVPTNIHSFSSISLLVGAERRHTSN